MWGFIIALLSGALMSIQGVFNTEVTKQTSIWVSAGFVQLTAFFTCVIMWLVTGRNEVGGLFQVQPWYMPVSYTHLVSTSYFQATGQPMKASILSMLRQLLVLIPMILILPLFFQLDVILYAGPVADISSAVVVSFFVVYEMKKLNRVIGESK